MAAYLLVRAQVHDRARRGDFDHWYQTRHLPEAKAARFAGRNVLGMPVSGERPGLARIQSLVYFLGCEN